MEEGIRLYVLHPQACMIEVDGEEFSLVGDPLRLLIYLALQAPVTTRYSRSALALFFAPREDDAANYLSTVIGNAQKTMKKFPIRRPPRAIEYDAGEVWVDALEFQERCRNLPTLKSNPEKYWSELITTYDLYQAELLHGYNEGLPAWKAWCKNQRKNYEAYFHQLMENIVGYHISRSDYISALYYAEQWHRKAPNTESSIQYLIWLHYWLGQLQLAFHYVDLLEELPINGHSVGLNAKKWRHVLTEEELYVPNLAGLESMSLDFPPVTSPAAKKLHVHMPTNTFIPSIDIRELNENGDFQKQLYASIDDIKQGHLQSAKTQLESLTNNLKGDESPSLLTEIYHQLGIVHIKLANFPQAESMLQQAFDIAERHHLYARQGAILANTGMLLYFQGNYVKAKEVYKESYQWAELANDELIKGVAESNLGLVIAEMKDYTQAVFHYGRALHSFHHTGNNEQSAYLHLNLANLYFYLQDYAKASFQVNQGGALAHKLAHPELVSLYHWNAGTIAAAIGRWRYAKADLKQGLALTIDVGLPWLNLAIETELGKVFLREEKWEESNRTLERVFHRAVKINNRGFAVKALYGLCLGLLSYDDNAGFDDAEYSLKLVKRKLAREYFLEAAEMGIDMFDIDEADFLFRQGMIEYSTLSRYRIADVLETLLIREGM